jgi:hypothetical protein
MLPRPVYNKVLQDLKRIKKSWDEDGAEDPNKTTYDISLELASSIEHAIKTGKVNCHGQQDIDILVDQTCKYLLKTGLIIRSPYGGYSFPIKVTQA